MTLMYIHGYGSTGQAYKAKLLQEMIPDHKVISPTLDYDRIAPEILLEEVLRTIEIHQPSLVMGSSMGGYFALCAMRFYPGVVWCVNPVRDILSTLQFLSKNNPELASSEIFIQRLAEYKLFNDKYFVGLKANENQLHLALSTDDEVLGNHEPLLQLFPNTAKVVWKDQCGHRFLRFSEIKKEIEESLLTESL